jgi:subtilisin family serine protease
VAAGNSNASACTRSPSRVAEALTVAATTSTDARSPFSNYGTCVDLFAPGSSITSSWYTSITATNTISGTSTATAHVTGVAAALLQRDPGAHPATIQTLITSGSTRGVVLNAGTGSPNRLLRLRTPCGTHLYSGYLSGTGDTRIEPDGTSYTQEAATGLHQGCLNGPVGTDFDLYLEKWNGSSWAWVARSIGPTATEMISYTGTAGLYRWLVHSWFGGGRYTLELTHP